MTPIQNRSTCFNWKEIHSMPAQRFREVHPESNWLVTQLTHGRWSARLYQICFSSLGGEGGS
jgi:hypothetical protein